MTQHSKIVGGSTAKRLIACPGSYALAQSYPTAPSSSYADEGTLLHTVIAEHLEYGEPLTSFIGMQEGTATLTQELIDAKLTPALAVLPDVRFDNFRVEQQVGFTNKALAGVFGTADAIGRRGNTAIVLDWKFGAGVPVPAEENSQLMFYAAAAMQTPNMRYIFDGATEVELIIVQPPGISRWSTTPKRIKAFERELTKAVNTAKNPEAPLSMGEHCRFCPAKAICPEMTGAADRALQVKVDNMPTTSIAQYLNQIQQLKAFITAVEETAQSLAEKGAEIPGYKLVAKRGRRMWADEKKVLDFLGENAYTKTLVTPAQAEKIADIPADMIVSVSSGSTLVKDDDPRPKLINLNDNLKNALKRIS